MNKTGVFATKEEIEELQKLAKETANTPVIAFSGAHAMRGGFHEDVRQCMMKRCYEVAKSHGLPEIDGYYGLTPEGEFVTA